jgi:glycine cleavage system aminomethyltransferase T
MRTADEILAQAKQLSPEERRRVAEELLDELDRSLAEGAQPGKGPYGPWLDAAGSVRSDFTDLSTDKYQHVAAASLHGHDEA